jgi:mRNA interferase MazF
VPPERSQVHRGDIFWADLDPTQGHEQEGRRPVLIVSNERLHQMGIVIIVPLSKQVQKGNRTHRILIEENHKIQEQGTDGCPGESLALTEQVRCLDLSRLDDGRVAKVSGLAMGWIEAGLVHVMDLF